VEEAFVYILSDFISDMDVASILVGNLTTMPAATAKVRIAAANSATLLISATFEEFIRQMAREYAKGVVANSGSVERLSVKLFSTVWQRTMGGLAKLKFDTIQNTADRNGMILDANTRFSVAFNFCKGDLTQDVYKELIHNENNMRTKELNNLFAVTGLKDVCQRISNKKSFIDVFGEIGHNFMHGKLTSYLDGFIDRRNAIAHTLTPGNSSSPDQIENDIVFLKCFGQALYETLIKELSDFQSSNTTPNEDVSTVGVPAEALSSSPHFPS
jgi:hypothetical protein